MALCCRIYALKSSLHFEIQSVGCFFVRGTV